MPMTRERLQVLRSRFGNGEAARFSRSGAGHREPQSGSPERLRHTLAPDAIADLRHFKSLPDGMGVAATA